ncbi:Rho GTPase activation protein [Lactarius quietus]|nr:Rho GTPase activation protein [Lactarius quietus]
MRAWAAVERAFAGTDTSGVKASFNHNFSLSIPPLTLYCNYRPDAYSDLIFGVPLVNSTTSPDNVPKVIRMCIEEVEKRGLDTRKIYSVGSMYDQEVLELRCRFESEKSFSFSSVDNIHSVAMLLMLYIRDLPEPLFMLSLTEYRNYLQNRAKYTENKCSVLRSRIRELHPFHRASLEALLRHLCRVASRSDKNVMTVEALAIQFYYTILRGNAVLETDELVTEDLIQNAPILFDPSSPPESVRSGTTDFSLSTSLLSSLG